MWSRTLQDIVDRCCVWESHAEDTDSCGARPSPNRPVYQIDDVRTESGPDVSLEDQDLLGSFMQHLLPNSAVSPPRATPIPFDREQPGYSAWGTSIPCGHCCGSVLVSRTWRFFCRICFRSDHWRWRIRFRRWVAMSRRWCVFRWQVDWTGDGFVMRPPQKVADCHQAGTVV